jgi:hypothetical protein
MSVSLAKKVQFAVARAEYLTARPVEARAEVRIAQRIQWRKDNPLSIPAIEMDNGRLGYTEPMIDALTQARKVRPARSAFGDWNQYDSQGEPVLDCATVTEHDDLANDWGYATSTEQRLAERGDDVEYDAAGDVRWSTGKDDAVTFSYRKQEVKSYTLLHGYHKESDGVITCWYCANTFSAKWFVRNNGLDRNVMEAFAAAAVQHTAECYDGSSAMIRFVTWKGECIVRKFSKQDMVSLRKKGK